MINLRLTLKNADNKSTLSRRRWIGISVLLVVAIIGVVLHSKNKTNATTEPAISAMTITQTDAMQASWPKTVQTSGSITAWREAIIGSEISGQRLVEVLVDVGDTVKKGQVLARYNKDMLFTQKAELEANWIQADTDRKRALTLKKSGAMSAQLVETYVNKAAVAKARLDAKNLELKYADIVAPDDGVISSRTATIGAVGNAGTELFRLILDNRLEWRGELTATQLTNIAEGQVVKLTLPDGSAAEAKVRRISPAFNAQSRMATVYADISPGSHAHAGMYATGMIEMGLNKVITVPAESVVIRDGYSYVFKLAKQGEATQVVQQPVTTGRHQENQVEIIVGLNQGEHVANKGAGFLRDGDHVRLVSEPEQKA